MVSQYSSLIYLSLISMLAYIGNAENMCPQIQPCKDNVMNSLQPCIDSCHSQLDTMGADYTALKQCVNAKGSILTTIIHCIEQQNAAACGNTGKMVPKRYPETIKVAVMAELNRMSGQSGISDEMKPFIGVANKMYSCVRKCTAQKSGNCDKQLGCGLDLPSDTLIVQNAKQCAMRSGVSTQTVQQMCNCAVKAGMKQLAGVCSKIIIQ